jgi:formate hydrogenlyase subunit 4
MLHQPHLLKATAILALLTWCWLGIQETALGAEPPQALPVYQKEALSAIKDLTSNLLLFGVGVFALVGGYLAKDHSAFYRTGILKAAFVAFGVSLIAGLSVFMALIAQLQAQQFDPNAVLVRWGAIVQILATAVGAVCFFCFLVGNIETKPQGG